MAKQGRNFKYLDDNQSVINLPKDFIPDESFPGLYYKKENVQDYVNYIDDTQMLDTYCHKCKRTIGEDEEYMKCCPDEEYIQRWMNCKATYFPRCFHKFCHRCCIEYVTNVTQSEKRNFAEGLPCIESKCTYKFAFSEGNWPHEIEKLLFDRVLLNGLVIAGMKIFKCKKCSCQTLITTKIQFQACKNCKTYICIECQRPATVAHKNLSCQQMKECEAAPNSYFIVYNSIFLSSSNEMTELQTILK